MTSSATTSLADGTIVDRMAHFDLNDFRVLLITMAPGAHMKQHQAAGTISVQVLKGRFRVTSAGSRMGSPR